MHSTSSKSSKFFDFGAIGAIDVLTGSRFSRFFTSLPVLLGDDKMAAYVVLVQFSVSYFFCNFRMGLPDLKLDLRCNTRFQVGFIYLQVKQFGPFVCLLFVVV